MTSPALAYPFARAAEQIDREATRLERAHYRGDDHGASVAQLRGSLIEDMHEVIEGCGPDELVALARVFASFARRVR